jgi:broad specificity phosphatase PhoE
MHITLLRHAHSAPDRDDINRVLSNKGIEQALNYRKRIMDIQYDLVIHSIASRTKETAAALLLGKETKFQQIQSLYLPSKAEDIALVSKAIMLCQSSCLRDLMVRYPSDAWQRYADEAYNEICSVDGFWKHEKVLIVCHGAIINLLGLKFRPEFNWLKDRYFGYVEGYSLTV